MRLISQINVLLEDQERKQALSVLVLNIIVAFLEVVGIASILPFMAVLSSPELVSANKYLYWFYNSLGFTSTEHYLFFLGVIALFLLVLGNAVKAIARWKTLDFSIMTGHTISSRLLRQYLSQPYDFFLSRNSSHLANSILDEVNKLVSSVMVPFTDVVARSIIVVSILLLLTVANPILAISTGFVLGGAFVLVYVLMRKWLLRTGEQRLAAQERRYQIISEAFLGIKNIKLTGNEKTYIRLYNTPSLIYSKTTAMAGVAGEVPRYAMEVIAFGGILFIILFLLLQNQGLSQALPLITLYAFAGYRLMPSLQLIFQSYTRIRFHSAVLTQIHREIELSSIKSDQAYLCVDSDVSPLGFDREIVFKDVYFSYGLGGKEVLKNLNFSLPKSTTIGLVGKTGAGKTTIVDLLLGLLIPTKGEILIDGVPLTNETRRAWQKNCSYVSQHIYLTDDTVRANIAFGVPKDDVDEDLVRVAAKMAAVDEFVLHDLPQGYDTIVGENGVRLSGGQRQRIGLARALYLNRPILVLDESTSALDVSTEARVMDSISALAGNKTIVIIAHRQATLKKCDYILELGDGITFEPKVRRQVKEV